jgi:hypothetical protein
MKNEKYFKPDTYVVALKNHVAGIFAFNKGEIAKIINSKSIEYQSTKWAFANGSKYEEEGDIKWFETLEEAQAFSKFLFSPSIPPSIPETKTFDDFGIDPEMEYEHTIINSWQGQGTNKWLGGSYCTNEGTWSYHITIFTSNRKLSRLEFKNGIWGLYVNGSANIFIKAEGFIEYYRAELLKMAIQNYPIGTKHCSALDGTADGECRMTPCWNICGDAINGGNRYIWFKGKWGKILDVPTEKNEEPVDKGWFDKELRVEEEFKIGDVVTIKHSNAVEQDIPELTHNIKPNSINNNLKSTTAVVGTIKQKSKTIKF